MKRSCILENKTILLTGASGYLGKEIARCYPNVTTLGRNPDSQIICDLSDSVPLITHRHSLVIHAAGKAHLVPNTHTERSAFHRVNVDGTRNLLSSLSGDLIKPDAFLFISSVSVYGLSNGAKISETTPLRADDPYGKSKIEAERIIRAWCLENGVRYTALRLPLVVGADPPGNLGAMIKAINKGFYFNIAGGKARKSMVLINDVVDIIPKAAEIGGVYNLTDGVHPTFFALSSEIAIQLGKSKPKNMPIFFASFLAKIGDIVGDMFPFNTHKLNKIVADLIFDDTLARLKLGWKPHAVTKYFKV